MSVDVKCEVKEEEELQENPRGKSRGRREEESSSVRFQCGRCGLTEFCHYFGKEPYFCGGAVKFAEDTFVLKDPFSAETFDVRYLPRSCLFTYRGDEYLVSIIRMLPSDKGYGDFMPISRSSNELHTISAVGAGSGSSSSAVRVTWRIVRTAPASASTARFSTSTDSVSTAPPQT